MVNIRDIRISPHDIDDNNKLLSCFGKFEMECAARRIIKLAKESNDWNIPLNKSLFQGENEIDGFFDLKSYGWFIEKENFYYVKPGFLRRLEDYINNHKNKTI